MAADFWAGYISGATSILVGNPLDIYKVRRQAGRYAELAASGTIRSPVYLSLTRGASAPVLGYGALNALLFVSYNRALLRLDVNISDPTNTPNTKLSKIWVAGAVGGLTTWVISAPTELIKCKAQLRSDNHYSWDIARDVWRSSGIKGLYQGGGITSIRDSVGYGFYFSSYELSKRIFAVYFNEEYSGAKVVLCGGIAGVVTWASIFPLDVIKTRIQSPIRWEEQCRKSRNGASESQPRHRTLGSIEIARKAYEEGGIGIFFRGLGICSLRAFLVNAIQWSVYEWMIRVLEPKFGH